VSPRSASLTLLVLAAACSRLPTEGPSESIDSIVDAGPVTPCANGGHVISTSFVSYGYFDTADGLIECQNFAFVTAQSVCLYKTAQNEVSETNLCSTLKGASSCTYSMEYWVGQTKSDATEQDYYLPVAFPNLPALKSSCATIGGKWASQ